MLAAQELRKLDDQNIHAYLTQQLLYWSSERATLPGGTWNGTSSHGCNRAAFSCSAAVKA